jgi:hypothetical protein
MPKGYGGVVYIARVLGISRRTIYRGIAERKQMGQDDPKHPRRPSGSAGRIRRRGGGRRKATEAQAGLEEGVEVVLEAHSRSSARRT